MLLDEIGRGTSTYDGVAIAWAVTEHLHDRVGCKTMFATHYHELMQLPERLQHARNYNVAVRETGDTVVFLHRLEPGGTDRSYGIHVAQLAGLPGDGAAAGPGDPGHARGRAPDGARRSARRCRATRDSSRCSGTAPPDPMVEELQALDVERAHAARGAQPAGGLQAPRAEDRQMRAGDDAEPPAHDRLALLAALGCLRRRSDGHRGAGRPPARRRGEHRRAAAGRDQPGIAGGVSAARCWNRASRAACCSGSTSTRRAS